MIVAPSGDLGHPHALVRLRRADTVAQKKKIMAPKNSGAIMQTKVAAPRSKTSASLPNSWESLLSGISTGKTALEVGMNRNIFLQGERADSVYYLKDGAVKLAVTSEEGKDRSEEH